ncbi:tripartite tricarboxylate transporter permease [soil metagenome]
MDLLNNLQLGFSTALSLQNLTYALLGCLTGTLIGVLPGLGPVVTIAMLLPLTYGLEPTTALIMLASIYYGSQYGGSTTAILVNLPGESSSAITLIEGHQMARAGRAGPALAAAAIGSFFAGCVGTLLLAAFAAPLAEIALRFGSPEYFSLMLLGLIGAVTLSSGPLLKSIGMVVLGLLLGLVGTDVNSGSARFALGLPNLLDGFDFACLAMGIFGIGEIIATLERSSGLTETFVAKVGSLWPTRTDLRRMVPSMLRGTAVGSLLGILPGAGVTVASSVAYTVEKKVSKYSSEFGRGAIEGVTGPEAANNAAAQTNFIPLLTLGIPGSAVMALLVGAMMVHNIQPGPQIIRNHPDLFWGLIASMWIGNVMLVVLNLPLVGLWVSLLKVPYKYLYPAILAFCSIGVYSLQGASFDIYQMAAFGLLGYLLIKLDASAVPLLLGFVMGPMLEENFRRSLLLSSGSLRIFVERPFSLVLIVAAVAMLIAVLAPAVRRKRSLIDDDALLA